MTLKKEPRKEPRKVHAWDLLQKTGPKSILRNRLHLVPDGGLLLEGVETGVRGLGGPTTYVKEAIFIIKKI